MSEQEAFEIMVDEYRKDPDVLDKLVEALKDNRNKEYEDE